MRLYHGVGRLRGFREIITRPSQTACGMRGVRFPSVRLTTCASAAGAQARARTTQRFHCLATRRPAPAGSSGPPRPVGCMRGLGASLLDSCLTQGSDVALVSNPEPDMRALPVPHSGAHRWLPLSLAILTGCSSWRVQPASPAQVITEEHPAEIRLGRTDRQQVVLKRPVLRGDSIWGQTGKDSAGVPLDEITTIAVRRTDWLKTTGLVVVSTSAVLGVVCAATCDFAPTLTFRPE
jgi:hypothetical protein